MSFRPRKPVERCYEIRYGADTPAYLLMLFELYFIHGKITLYLLYSHGSAENHCFCYFLSVPQNAFIAGNYDTSADHDNMFFQIKVPVPSLSVTPWWTSRPSRCIQGILDVQLVQVGPRKIEFKCIGCLWKCYWLPHQQPNLFSSLYSHSVPHKWFVVSTYIHDALGELVLTVHSSPVEVLVRLFQVEVLHKCKIILWGLFWWLFYFSSCSKRTFSLFFYLAPGLPTEHSECSRIFTKHGQKPCAPHHCDASPVNTSHGTVATRVQGHTNTTRLWKAHCGDWLVV